MIDAVELGRKMMRYAPKLDDDAEFNQWCRLAPKLIGLGTNVDPNSFNHMERALINKAIMILVTQGEITD